MFARVAAVVAYAMVTATTSAVAGNGSAFATVRFEKVVQLDLPKDWSYLDQKISQHLLASTEAVASIVNEDIKLGEKRILVAANAQDAQGKTHATIRLSVSAPSQLVQADLKGIDNDQETLAEMRRVGQDTAKSMLKAPGVRAYVLREARIDRNGSMACFLTVYDADFGRGPVVSRTHSCPFEQRTLTLSTMYDRRFESIYKPILDKTWRSLKVIAAP